MTDAQWIAGDNHLDPRALPLAAKPEENPSYYTMPRTYKLQSYLKLLCLSITKGSLGDFHDV